MNITLQGNEHLPLVFASYYENLDISQKDVFRKADSTVHNLLQNTEVAHHALNYLDASVLSRS